MGSTVYIESEGVHISLKEDQLIIKNGETQNNIPIKLIDSIIIKGNTTLTSNIIVRLIGDNVKITFLGYYGNYNCSIYPEMHGNILTRHNQLRLSDNKTEALKIAINILRGKVTNQINIIKRHIRNYGENKNTVETVEKIDLGLSKLMLSQKLDQLMGYEGACAKLYFGSFSELIRNQDFRWNGRDYNPPKDEINAIL